MIAVSWLLVSPIDGDFGPICISVGGGGLGSRGELGGRDMARYLSLFDPQTASWIVLFALESDP